MQRRLVQKGYCVLRRLVPEDKCNELLEIGKKQKKFSSIFKAYKVGDDDRLQTRVPARTVKELRDILTPFAKTHFPGATLNDWFYLKSRPGGVRQAPHKDYVLPVEGTSYFCILSMSTASHTTCIVENEPAKHLDALANMPGGLLLALQPDTKLYTYGGWNRTVADEREEKRIDLDVGDVLLFRGDFVHAGADYDEDNIRIHCYIDVPTYKRPNDTTRPVRYIRKDGTYVDHEGKETKLFDPEDDYKCGFPDCNYFASRGPSQKQRRNTLQKHRQRLHPQYRTKRVTKTKASGASDGDDGDDEDEDKEPAAKPKTKAKSAAKGKKRRQQTRTSDGSGSSDDESKRDDEVKPAAKTKKNPSAKGKGKRQKAHKSDDSSEDDIHATSKAKARSTAKGKKKRQQTPHTTSDDDDKTAPKPKTQPRAKSKGKRQKTRASDESGASDDDDKTAPKPKTQPRAKSKERTGSETTSKDKARVEGAKGKQKRRRTGSSDESDESDESDDAKPSAGGKRKRQQTDSSGSEDEEPATGGKKKRKTDDRHFI